MFKPGQSGNPGGRMRRPLSNAYKALLESKLPEPERIALRLAKGATWSDAIALALARQSLTKGGVSVAAATELRTAVEGRSPVIQFALSGEQAPHIVVTYDLPSHDVLEAAVAADKPHEKHPELPAIAEPSEHRNLVVNHTEDPEKSQ
jgi:hypothetical protein